MKTTLAEIKRKLDKYDKALAKFQKNPNVATMGGRNAHELLMAAHDDVAKVDYLRALLTVVDTAAEIREPTVVTDGQTKMECACCGNRIRASIRENQHEEDCPWWVLQKALKALE